MIEAVIFDLDGTLLDTLDDLTNAVNHALGVLGYAALDRATVKRFVGNGIRKLTDRALVYSQSRGERYESENGEKIEHAEQCFELCRTYYAEHGKENTRLYDGVKEMLDRIKSMGVKTAVVTNKLDSAAQALRTEFFPDVDFVIGLKDGINPKPAPDGVNAALKVLGVDKHSCIYVGDGETDMLTATNCGLPAIAVTWGFRDREVLSAFSPEYIVEDPEEIVRIIGE